MDPVDDTAQVLASYGLTFGQDPARWSFLTGDQTEMRRLVGASFLPPDTTGQFGYMPGNFAHTQRIALVDKAGHIRLFAADFNKPDKSIAELVKAAP